MSISVKQVNKKKERKACAESFSRCHLLTTLALKPLKMQPAGYDRVVITPTGENKKK